MEGIADEGGEEGIDEEEGGQEEVGEVGGDGLEVFIEPRHDGCGVLNGVLYYEIIVTFCCISRLLLTKNVR